MSDETSDNSDTSGGFAFPTQGSAHEFTGMTLLDWFAGQALASIDFVRYSYGSTQSDYSKIAEHAFGVAEAMMAERARRMQK
jgi:hypothetical protein